MISAQSSGAHSIGWASSLCLHAMLAFGALILMHRVGLAPQPAPFRWDVAVLAASSESVSSNEPSKAIEAPAGIAPSSAPLPNTSQRPQKSRTVRTIERPLAAGEPMVHRNPLPVEETEQASATEELSAASEMVASKPLEQEAQLASRPQVLVSPAEMLNTVSPSVSSAGRPDYAWLAETIMRRMQELKKYPAEARLDRAEGKVVLKAVIRNDGGIESVEVFRSSGHQTLDQAAVDLLSLAAPFHFPRPLERSQMTVKIPMSYRLDP